MTPFRERNPVIIGAVSLAVLLALLAAAFNAQNLPLIGGGEPDGGDVANPGLGRAHVHELQRGGVLRAAPDQNRRQTNHETQTHQRRLLHPGCPRNDHPAGRYLVGRPGVHAASACASSVETSTRFPLPQSGV